MNPKEPNPTSLCPADYTPPAKPGVNQDGNRAQRRLQALEARQMKKRLDIQAKRRKGTP